MIGYGIPAFFGPGSIWGTSNSMHQHGFAFDKVVFLNKRINACLIKLTQVKLRL
jgi:hypothetical protein